MLMPSIPIFSSKDGEPIAFETVSVMVTDKNGLTTFSSSTIELPPPSYPPVIAVTPRVAGVLDFGAEWIGNCGGLPGSSANAGGFVSNMLAAGWIKRFNWGNFAAWEQDFKDPSLAGDDSNWVDNADIVFYTGHANGDGFTFCDNNHDDTFLHYTEARWGNKDLEWLIIAACGPLQGWLNWRPAFYGLHLLMAYTTSSLDNEIEGRLLAQWALGKQIGFITLPPIPLRAAWINAANAAQPHSVTWAIMGVIGADGLSKYNDYLWGKGPVGPDLRGASIWGYWRLSGPC